MVARVWEIIDYPYGEDADGLFFQKGKIIAGV